MWMQQPEVYCLPGRGESSLRGPGMSAGGPRERWDANFAGRARGQTLERIWRAAYGEEYPQEADPNGWTTLSELRRIASELRVGPRETFVDLGCGAGGPGLWVARATGAAVVGIDVSAVAVEQATRRASVSGLGERAHFQVGDFQATGLPDAAFDGAMSVDVLLLVPDKPAAVREVARILRPGARFIFTTRDVDLPSLRGITAAQVADHRPLLVAAGFVVEAYEEPPDWERGQQAVYAGILDAQSLLIEEMGEPAARRWIEQAQQRPDELPHARSILVVARRT